MSKENTNTQIYELVVIFKVAMLEKEAEETVSGIVGDIGGKVIEVDSWGKKTMAYKIDKESEGLYIIYRLELPKQVISDLRKKLQLEEEVLRTMLVRRG